MVLKFDKCNIRRRVPESPLGMVNKPIDDGVLVASYFAMLQRRIFVVIKRIDHRLDSIIFTVSFYCDVYFAFKVNIQYSWYCDIVKKSISIGMKYFITTRIIDIIYMIYHISQSFLNIKSIFVTRILLLR